MKHKSHSRLPPITCKLAPTTRKMVFVDPDDSSFEWFWPALVVPRHEFRIFQSSVGEEIEEPGEDEHLVVYFEDVFFHFNFNKGSFSVVPQVDCLPFCPYRPPYLSYLMASTYKSFETDVAMNSATKYWETGISPDSFNWLKHPSIPIENRVDLEETFPLKETVNKLKLARQKMIKTYLDTRKARKIENDLKNEIEIDQPAQHRSFQFDSYPNSLKRSRSLERLESPDFDNFDRYRRISRSSSPIRASYGNAQPFSIDTLILNNQVENENENENTDIKTPETGKTEIDDTMIENALADYKSDTFNESSQSQLNLFEKPNHSFSENSSASQLHLFETNRYGSIESTESSTSQIDLFMKPDYLDNNGHSIANPLDLINEIEENEIQEDEVETNTLEKNEIEENEIEKNGIEENEVEENEIEKNEIERKKFEKFNMIHDLEGSEIETNQVENIELHLNTTDSLPQISDHLLSKRKPLKP